MLWLPFYLISWCVTFGFLPAFPVSVTLPFFCLPSTLPLAFDLLFQCVTNCPFTCFPSVLHVPFVPAFSLVVFATGNHDVKCYTYDLIEFSYFFNIVLK